ncbi:hypothetical protein XENOCAPTIV_025488, partial [Xenoophorus captivus]
LQREEEEAYASSHAVHSQSPAGHASLAPFSKFEEKKTNEKTRKVTTVKKFFSPSSRTASKKGSSESVEQVMDQVEKYIMTRLYKSVFCPETTDDEKKDLSTQNRIRALHWVTIQMLCVSMDEEIPEVSENVVKAITDIIEMDSKRVPRDKLACITLAFIEKLDAQSLNLSPEEFERYMSGQASPRFSSSEGEWTDGAQGVGVTVTNPVLAQLNHNLELLSGLCRQQEAVMEAAKSLQADLLSWSEGVQREVQGILEKYPLEIKSSKVFAIDANNVDNENLPSPIKPQVFAG